MNKAIAILVTCITLSNSALAVTSTGNDEKEAMTKAFVQRQVEQNMSIGRAIKSIVSHYPQDAEIIISTALDLYPKHYKEIIHAAIAAEPALTPQVVTIALNKGISSCSSIVETAISAEPSYVDFVVRAAANATPEELDEIVRVAVVTEPDSADTIVQTLSQSHPNQMVEILRTAMGAVPFVGEYMVDALLAVFPGEAEDVVTTAVRESNAQREQIARIIETAENAGVAKKDITQYAINAGLTKEEIDTLLAESDNK